MYQNASSPSNRYSAGYQATGTSQPNYGVHSVSMNSASSSQQPQYQSYNTSVAQSSFG